METLIAFDIQQAVESALFEFIQFSIDRRHEQILNTREFFKKHVGQEVDPADHFSHSWFYVSPYGSDYHKREDGYPDYSRPMRRFSVRSLTKAGSANYHSINRPIEKQLAEYKAAMISKIVKALTKHDATAFRPVRVQNGPLGLEGLFIIGDGRTAEFSAIMAGGWNIQCLHYRYTVRVQ